MSLVYSNLTQEFTATKGTGPVLLHGTMPGYRAFGSVMQDGDTCNYGIREFSTGAFEFGLGTYNSAANTISRAPSDSSNQGTAIALIGSPITKIYMCVDTAVLVAAAEVEALAAAAMPATPEALTALFQTWMASLPTTLPGAPGVVWNDGGTPAIS